MFNIFKFIYKFIIFVNFNHIRHVIIRWGLEITSACLFTGFGFLKLDIAVQVTETGLKSNKK